MLEDIELVWTPTIAAVDAAQRARRRATRVTWLEWAFCGAAIVFVAPGVPTADPYALFVVVLCVLLATGLWGFGYRWVVHYRFNPQLYTEARITLTDDGIVETQAGTTVHVPWERWKRIVPVAAPARCARRRDLGGRARPRREPRPAAPARSRAA